VSGCSYVATIRTVDPLLLIRQCAAYRLVASCMHGVCCSLLHDLFTAFDIAFTHSEQRAGCATCSLDSRAPPQLCCRWWWWLFTAVWELYTGEYAFQRLQHPGQFFEAVVLHDFRPVIPQGTHNNMAWILYYSWGQKFEQSKGVGQLRRAVFGSR